LVDKQARKGHKGGEVRKELHHPFLLWQSSIGIT